MTTDTTALLKLAEIATRLERYSDDGQHMRIPGPSAGQAWEAAQELRLVHDRLAAAAPDQFPDVGKKVPLPSDVEASVSNAAEPVLCTSQEPVMKTEESVQDATPGQGAEPQELSECQFPNGHLWSASIIDGKRSCAWCPANKLANPEADAQAGQGEALAAWKSGTPDSSRQDESGFSDGFAVQLPQPTFDGGPAIRGAGYDHAVGGFVCDSTAALIPSVLAWIESTPPPARSSDEAENAARYLWLKANNIIRVFPISSGSMSRGGSRILADTKDWLPGDFTYVIEEVTSDVDAAIDFARDHGTAEGGA